MASEVAILATECSSETGMETKRGPLTPLSATTRKRKNRWGERLEHPISNCGAQEHGANVASVVHEDDLSLKRYKHFRRGRSSSTCRYNRPTFQHQHNAAEWRCIVCYLWNSRGRQCCSRCGAGEGVDKAGSSVRHSEPPARRGNQNHEMQAEEFKWPSLFETNGADYVFDPRSNMFYEQKSDFFYDCNSKLYYSNKKKAYFRRIERPSGSVFQIVSGSASTKDSTESSMPLPVGLTLKPTIEIRIRSKSLSVSRAPRRQSRGKSHAEESLDKKRKEEIQHIKKWNNLSRNSRDNSLARTVASMDSNDKSMQDFLQMAEQASQAIAKTLQVQPLTDSRPICILCKRKFASLDQLRRHEQQSELHKTNLAKKKADESAALTSQQQETLKYQDRAQKRRLLHGDLSVAPPAKRIEQSRQLERTDVIDPEAALGQHNVGNQLFHKMLSRSSKPLPKDTPTGLCETIKADWRRIENMSNTRAFAQEFPQDKEKGIGFEA